jgi:hypothetical protein
MVVLNGSQMSDYSLTSCDCYSIPCNLGDNVGAAQPAAHSQSSIGVDQRVKRIDYSIVVLTCQLEPTIEIVLISLLRLLLHELTSRIRVQPSCRHSRGGSESYSGGARWRGGHNRMSGG